MRGPVDSFLRPSSILGAWSFIITTYHGRTCCVATDDVLFGAADDFPHHPAGPWQGFVFRPQ